MPPNPSLPTNQRGRVLETYRARGRRNNNIWLVYSAKKNEDIVLHSDGSLIHWLTFLETDPSVRSFSPISSEVSKTLQIPSSKAMLLTRSLYDLEIHVVDAEASELSSVQTDLGLAKIRTIGKSELQDRSRLAVRWLKAIGYVGLFRNQGLAAISNQITPCLMQRKQGTMDDLVNDLPGADRPTLYAAIVKAAIRGHVELDLSTHGFCGASGWKWTDR